VSVVDSRSVSVELAFGVDRRGDGLAARHSGTLEDVLGIPVLSEVEAVAGSFDINAEEEAEGARVPNSELGSEPVDDLMK